MKSNKPDRVLPWRPGSFTKNFGWGKPEKGFARLHSALNTGFDSELKPVTREQFWNRLDNEGYIPHIPANFFVFNGILGGVNYIFPDELVFKALSQPHDTSFDKLVFFTLLLSEVGTWKGARNGQSQPSEWARFFALQQLDRADYWRPKNYTADKIEEYLRSESRFEGGAGTRKLATNLSYFFSQAGIEHFFDSDDPSWLTDCIFLALDRYYMKYKPEKLNIDWAINTLAENEVADLAGPFEESFLDAQSITARLFIESNAVERLEDFSFHTTIGILSREPLLYKVLPSIAGEWLKSRLFVEFVSTNELEQIREFDSAKFYNAAIKNLHNKVPKPSLSGNELLALVRPNDDNN